MSEPQFTLSDLDFQLESLSFADISPAEFENLIFHLVDEMGFSNLVWRKGGEGNSATDGGRDLEATFWRIEPVTSHEMKFWYEVKYRTNQLERSQVQKAILDASASQNIDCLVIVTNSTVSNPCLDWIRDFQRKQARPVIAVWQGHDLELILRKNPRTLARFIPTALAFSGRCKVIESRFLNLFLLPSVDELVDLWQQRDSIKSKSFLLLAAALSEAAYGRLEIRPWGMNFSNDVLIETFATGMVNVYPLIHRISTLDRSQEPLIDGLAYLLACVLVRVGPEEATEVLFEPEQYFDKEPLPDEHNFNRLKPVLATLNDQLAMHCSAANSCSKLYHRDPDHETAFFAQFSHRKTKKEDRFLVLSSHNNDCELGLVAKGDFCPLPDVLPEQISRDYVAAKLTFAASVLRQRVAEFEAKAKAEGAP